MPIDVIDLLAMEGDGYHDHVLCPDCNGAGYLMDVPAQPQCPRCGGAGYVPLDSLTERERAAWADLLEEQARMEGPLSGDIPEEELPEEEPEEEEQWPFLGEDDDGSEGITHPTS